MTDAVRHEIRDGVAWITIDRPEVRNALDGMTFHRLSEVVSECGRDDLVRCLVIRGGGDRVFVAGADISEFREQYATPELAIAYDGKAEELNRALESIPQPVIAMLNGHAVGSGCLLAIACDFRIASARAKLGIPVAKIGFPPGRRGYREARPPGRRSLGEAAAHDGRGDRRRNGARAWSR